MVNQWRYVTVCAATAHAATSYVMSATFPTQHTLTVSRSSIAVHILFTPNVIIQLSFVTDSWLPRRHSNVMICAHESSARRKYSAN